MAVPDGTDLTDDMALLARTGEGLERQRRQFVRRCEVNAEAHVASHKYEVCRNLERIALAETPCLATSWGNSAGSPVVVPKPMRDLLASDLADRQRARREQGR